MDCISGHSVIIFVYLCITYRTVFLCCHREVAFDWSKGWHPCWFSENDSMRVSPLFRNNVGFHLMALIDLYQNCTTYLVQQTLTILEDNLKNEDYLENEDIGEVTLQSFWRYLKLLTEDGTNIFWPKKYEKLCLSGPFLWWSFNPINGDVSYSHILS